MENHSHRRFNNDNNNHHHLQRNKKSFTIVASLSAWHWVTCYGVQRWKIVWWNVWMAAFASFCTSRKRDKQFPKQWRPDSDESMRTWKGYIFIWVHVSVNSIVTSVNYSFHLNGYTTSIARHVENFVLRRGFSLDRGHISSSQWRRISCHSYRFTSIRSKSHCSDEMQQMKKLKKH